MDQKISTNSAEETQQLAQDFAQQYLEKGGIILLSGDLGAGKTTFTQGFIKSFNIQNKVISPTFLLVRQYQIPDTERSIFHIDLYRLATPINLKETGLSEILESAENNIILIEWPEKLGENLPPKYQKITIKKPNETTRQFTFENKQ